MGWPVPVWTVRGRIVLRVRVIVADRECRAGRIPKGEMGND